MMVAGIFKIPRQVITVRRQKIQKPFDNNMPMIFKDTFFRHLTYFEYIKN